MFEFFDGWRRKLGAATLLVALLFMGGWIRSFVGDDYLAFPDLFCVETGTWSLDGLAFENESLVLYAYVLLPILELETDPGEVEPATPALTILDTEPARQEPEPADALSAGSTSESATDDRIVAGEGSVSGETICSFCCFPGPEPVVTIPFCFIVLPLTMLSACLLLWNPRTQV